MYKPKYQSVLKEQGITYDDLVPKTKTAYDDIVAWEKELTKQRSLLKTASPESKGTLEADIVSNEAVYENMDVALCVAIEKNAAKVQTGERLKKGRDAATAKKKAEQDAAAKKLEGGGAADDVAATTGNRADSVVDADSNQQAAQQTQQTDQTATAGLADDDGTGDAAKIDEPKKKKGIFKWILFGLGAVTVVGLGYYGLTVNKDAMPFFPKKRK